VKAAVRMSRRTTLALTAALLAVALALGFLLLRASQGGRVLVANSDLAVGVVLAPSDFTSVSARLAGEASGYVSELPAGQVLSHSLRRGELLNSADLTLQAELGLVHLALNPTQPLAADVRVGSTVSIWFIPKSNYTNSATTPKVGETAGLIASGIQVLQISKNTDSLGTLKTQIEIAVSPQLVPAIIAIQAEDGNLSVIAQS
jgi:hypothetical protein